MSYSWCEAFDWFNEMNRCAYDLSDADGLLKKGKNAVKINKTNKIEQAMGTIPIIKINESEK